MPPTLPPPVEEELRDQVRAAQVCWEIAPHYELHEQDRVLVGFDLTLFARRPQGCTAPGCAACTRGFAALHQIADSVLGDGARYEIEPFDAAFQLRPENRWEPELRLVARVVHGGTFEPAGTDERDEARAVGNALTRLGAPERVWKQR
jgi:hypothetical protein